MKVTYLRAAVSLSLIASLGCGGAKTADENQQRRRGHMGKGTEHVGGEPDRDFPAEMADFHHAFDPLWHDHPGPQRDDHACTQTESLQSQAQAVVDAPVPDKIPEQRHEAWAAATSGLLVSVAALATACAAEGRPGVDDAIHDVHEAFHDIVVVWDGGH